MEQLNWHLYRKAKANWDDTPAKKRTGPPPEEPKPIFDNENPMKAHTQGKIKDIEEM